MCEENRSALERVESKSDAIALYKKTSDWALEEGYPNIDTLRRDFSDCEADGIFIDKHFNGELLDKQPVYVFHNCTGTIRTGLNVGLKTIPMLYFSNGCEMTVKGIKGSGLSVRVPLYVFGRDCRIIAEQSEDIVCTTFNFDTK
jgi:hypothetical protein